MKRSKQLIYALIIFVICIAIDQATKYYAMTYISKHSPIRVLGDFFVLYYHENRGAAWGIMQGKQWFLIVVSIVILFVLIACLCKIPSTKRHLPLQISIWLIIAGAVGNMIDRIIRNYVVDFLYLQKIDFPIFNVADCYVTVGAAILIILLLFVYKEDELDFIGKSKKEDKDGE